MQLWAAGALHQGLHLYIYIYILIIVKYIYIYIVLYIIYYMYIYIYIQDVLHNTNMFTHTRIRGLLLTQSCSMYDMLEDASVPHGCAVPTCRHSVRAAPCGCHSRSLVWTSSADPRCPSWDKPPPIQWQVSSSPQFTNQPVKKHLGPQTELTVIPPWFSPKIEKTLRESTRLSMIMYDPSVCIKN